MRGSVVHDLVRRAGNISVHVIPGDELPVMPTANRMYKPAARPEPFDPKPYLFALLIVAIGLGAAELIKPWFGIENVDLILTAVVSVAVRYGLWPSMLASVAASLCYNFFFLPPVYTFTITDPTNIAAFFFFMLIAILVSNVAARVRTQAVAATGRVRTTESLYAFSRKLAGTATLDDVLWATAYRTALMLKVRVVLLLPEEGVLTVKAGYPPRTSSTRPIWRRPTGRGATIARPDAARIRCRAPSACSCRCEPGAGRSASRDSRTADPQIAADGVEHAGLRAGAAQRQKRAGIVGAGPGADHSRSGPAGYRGP